MTNPDTVWRVKYYANAANVLQPRGYHIFQSHSEFQYRIQQHLKWDRSIQSPFLSVFSDKHHAIMWGRRLQKNYEGELYEINAKGLNMIRVGKTDEYLVMGDIPQRNVRNIKNLEDALLELNSASEDWVRHAPDRSYRPGREWYFEAEGWYSDEDDAYEDIDNQHFIEYCMNH